MPNQFACFLYSDPKQPDQLRLLDGTIISGWADDLKAGFGTQARASLHGSHSGGELEPIVIAGVRERPNRRLLAARKTDFDAALLKPGGPSPALLLFDINCINDGRLSDASSAEYRCLLDSLSAWKQAHDDDYVHKHSASAAAPAVFDDDSSDAPSAATAARARQADTHAAAVAQQQEHLRLEKAKMDKQQLARELAEAKKENQRLAKRLQKAEHQHHELPRARSPAAHSVNSSSSDSGVAPMSDADFPRNAADKATSSSAAKKRKEAPLSALPSLVNSSSKAARTLLADSAGKENRTAQEEAVQKLGALATELMHERSNQHLEAELLKARAAEYAAEQHALQSELELVHLLERVAGGSM